MRYDEQLSRVRALNVPRGSNRRLTCIGCGGAGTLSVGWEGPTLSWHCFRASCDVKGRASEARTTADIRASMGHRSEVVPALFVLPPHWVSIQDQPLALEWLRQNHCLAACKAGLTEVRWCAKDRRIIFLMKYNGIVTDAVGRALDRGVKPKWRRYGASGIPFICGVGRDLAVVVEDAASACSVCDVATGVALLGTSLLATHIPHLRQFKRCVVALDPDARAKSMLMASQLNAYLPTTPAFISDDLKYLSPAEIRRELNLHTE